MKKLGVDRLGSWHMSLLPEKALMQASVAVTGDTKESEAEEREIGGGVGEGDTAKSRGSLFKEAEATTSVPQLIVTESKERLPHIPSDFKQIMDEVGVVRGHG